jgi:type III secretory pathway component EscV
MAMLWLSGMAFAQRPVRVYATQKVESQVKVDATLNKKDTLFVARKKAIEKFIAQNSEWNQEKEIVIPVVFHIIYGSEKVYPGEKEAYYQLEALNRDFSGVVNELSNNKKNETYVKENFDKRQKMLSLSFAWRSQ